MHNVLYTSNLLKLLTLTKISETFVNSTQLVQGRRRLLKSGPAT